ncbi:MAG TPA: lipocalin-like domain-containing protein [Bryobacteraceae bacterium]|nr:lipocalin-like domain-containing protein [Bryobacteraceae bacterium]
MDRRDAIGILGLATTARLSGQTSDRDRFPGIYKLVSWRNTAPDGRMVEPMGADVIGRITYHKSGHMYVMIMRRGRQAAPRIDPQSAGIEELRDALQRSQTVGGGFVAYMGTYDVQADRHIVIHHLEGGSSPSFTGQHFERRYELTGKGLNLSAPPNFDSNKLVWERVADA